MICSWALDANPLSMRIFLAQLSPSPPSQPLWLDYPQQRRVDQTQRRVCPAHDGEEIRDLILPRPDFPQQAHAHGTYVPEEFDLGNRLLIVQCELTLLQYLINDRVLLLRGQGGGWDDPHTDQLHVMVVRLVGVIRGEVLAPHQIGAPQLLPHCCRRRAATKGGRGWPRGSGEGPNQRRFTPWVRFAPSPD